MQMRDANPRVMYGVIITVYVDRQPTTVQSFQGRRKKNEGERREIRKARGYDRRANLLTHIQQLRMGILAGDSKRGGESDNKPERPNPKKKKRRWIRKMFRKFRLPFRRKNRTWKYRQFDPDEEEGEARSKTNHNSDLWNKLKHVVGGLSRGCLRGRRDSCRQNKES
ncbi:PREDICTED: uncharacterized protein LOC104702562 [Camelina sativa]|uniref:Uncharacterized protein LOC104702562 n=1 Tax=Camelina sativa TaxID=90675 RepID=A0ABM0SVI0_CAMSA|nr:PREDICTED: uncharacterized protein LOC104702562 [Camelina sativa]